MTDQAPASRLAILERALESGADVAWCPAPRGGALSLADLRLGRFSAVWQDRHFPPGEGPRGEDDSKPSAVVGLDAACVVRPLQLRPLQGDADPTSRFDVCQAQITAALSALRMEPHLRPWVRFFGGSAFTEGRDGSGCWADFGEAAFFLPRVLYVDAPEGGKLILIAKRFPSESGVQDPIQSVPPAGERARRAALLAAAKTCLAALDAGFVRPGQEPPVTVLQRRTSADREAFSHLVGAARQEISAGVVAKVVAARRLTLTLSDAPQIAAVLSRLEEDAPSCTRFVMRIGERAFVGATPELLLSRRGTQLRTEALAGTAACSPTAGASAASTAAGGRDPGEGDQAAAQLRASSKDRAEHAIVVEAIKRALRPVCEDIDSPPEPRIRRLSRMVHLWSPMTARQTRQEPLLSLVARLHPTPAVGGLPRAQALSFISAHEAAERGWYASPVGFIDADGDGDFVVALRSALIHADRVHLFAGAGIVAESDPNAEFDETELKLGAMQRALGIA